MKNILGHVWWIVMVIGFVAMAITNYRGECSGINNVETAVLILTLSVLTRYAFDTKRLAEASDKHVDYLSTPVVTVSVEKRLLDSASSSDPNLTSVFYVKNDSRYQLEFRVKIVLQYGKHTSIHTDDYYSGKTVWNIGPDDSSNGNFTVLPFFKEIGDKPESVLDKLKTSDEQLKIYIFSEYRVFESDAVTFTRNMVRSYYLKFEEVPKGIHFLGDDVWLPFVWVYIFKAPPAEIRRLVYED